jgi:hypothetical protein
MTSEGKFLVPVTKWIVTGTAKAVLDSMVLTRVFNPANLAYVGVSRADAKIRYLERDSNWNYMQWLPLEGVSPVTWSIWTDFITYAGVKSCKPPQ